MAAETDLRNSQFHIQTHQVSTSLRVFFHNSTRDWQSSLQPCCKLCSADSGGCCPQYREHPSCCGALLPCRGVRTRPPREHRSLLGVKGGDLGSC